MSIRARNIIFITFLCIFVTGTVLLCIQSGEKRHLLSCERVEINLTDGRDYIKEDDIRRYLSTGLGSLIGQRIDSIKLYRIEEIIESKAAVKGCEAWTSPDGCLHLDISQREPAIRLIWSDGVSYADEEGFIFPLAGTLEVDVPEVRGAIPIDRPLKGRGLARDGCEREWVQGVLKLIDEMEDRKDLRGRLKSISVRHNGDLCIRLNDCQELFILGEAQEIEDKLDAMREYFRKIAPSKTEGYYKSVNLKYNKQIICRKDI